MIIPSFHEKEVSFWYFNELDDKFLYNYTQRDFKFH